MRRVHLGGRCYSIGVLNAREVTETLQRAREEESHQVAATGSGPAGDQAPSVLQMRMRILEISAVFSELDDGILRAVARRMRSVGLAARDTLRLGGQGGDVVVFLESGQVEASIVAFFSAKGGAGTTTLAINTAAALARKYPRQVLLIDLAAPFGHAALFADLIATGSVASATKAAQVDFESVLRGNIVNHKTGLGVLPGTLRPEEVDTLTGERVGRVLDVVVAWQKVIVVDLGTSLAEAALAVIERAECLVIVVPPEIAAMTDARRSLAIFRDIMNVPDNRMEMVLNLRSPHPPLDRAAVESILGRKMAVVVGFDDSRPEDSTLAGGLVLQHDPSSMVSRGAADISRVILSSLNLDG